MNKQTILEQISSNSNLLSMPQVLSEVIIETAKEDISADKLANIILKDPSLTGRILKMSNSSFYNQLAEIKTVQQAIAVMGITTVKCLALSSSLFHVDKIHSETGIDAKKFFGYILSVATAAKKIATITGQKAPEEVFIAGLLHDVGHIYLMHYYPKQISEIIKRNGEQRKIHEVENEILGINHTEISEAIMTTWKLPKDIIQAVIDHHNSNEITNNVNQNIIKLAILLSKDYFSGYELSIEDRMNGIANLSIALDLSQKDIHEISSLIMAETLQFAQYLDVEIGDVEDLLTTANREIWKSYHQVELLFKERQELTQSLLQEEHSRGAIESKNIAMATLSHYLNNAVMAIFGRTQLARMQLEKNQQKAVMDKLPDMIDKIESSVRKIVAVIEEMKEVSPIDQQKFDSMSKAMNIDDRIESRLSNMKEDLQMYESKSV